MLYCSTFWVFVSFSFNHLLGKVLYFFTSVSPTQPCCNSHKPLQVSQRKFLSIFLISFLWSHDFVVAEVCFRSLSSRMMKFLVRIFSAGPWRIWCNAGCYSALFQTRVKIPAPAEVNFQTEERGRFSFHAPEVSHKRKSERIHFKGIRIQLQLINFQSNVLGLFRCL